MEILTGIYNSGIGSFILSLWWIWGTFLLGWIFLSLWYAWRQALFKAKQVWALLEIKLPREAKRSPKVMEQIMMNIWALRNSPGNMYEWWWDGESTLWYSFEIVSFGGEIHFYLRTPAHFVNIIKANFYGHYPDCEVEEVQDYIEKLPKNLPELYQNGYDLFGLEMFTAKNNAYSIRTYEEFESDEESQNVDPIAGLLEVLSRVKPEHIVMMQIVSRPASVNPPAVVMKLAEAEIERLKEESAKKSGKIKAITEDSLGLSSRTPGETETMKKLDEKASKNYFECIIRYVYIAPKSSFELVLPYRGLRIAFQQFAVPNANHFDVNYQTWTRTWIWEWPYLFAKRRGEAHKARMWEWYRKRALPSGTFAGKAAQFHVYSSSFKQRISYLSTMELATLWHLPTEAIVTQPIMERIEAKKMGPPPGLPIYREGNQEIPGIMK